VIDALAGLHPRHLEYHGARRIAILNSPMTAPRARMHPAPRRRPLHRHSPGVGVARKPPVFLKAVAEVEIENIGILRNAVVGEGL